MKASVVTQIACYLKNQPGMLLRLTERLGQEGIFIKGIQNYEGELQSMVMLVVDQVEATEEILRSMGVELISHNDILEIEVPNRAGGLAMATRYLAKEGINIRTIYATDCKADVSLAYVRVDDLEKAITFFELERDQTPRPLRERKKEDMSSGKPARV